MAVPTNRKNSYLERTLLTSSFTRPLLKDSCKWFFLLPILLAFTTLIFLFSYISSISKLQIHQRVENPTVELSTINNPPLHHDHGILRVTENTVTENSSLININGIQEIGEFRKLPSSSSNVKEANFESIGSSSIDEHHYENNIFHDRALFMEEYKQMNRTLKIFTYPHAKNDPFANVLLPVNTEPGGNYASESYFKKSLFRSHFLTNNPLEADLFYLPFSIASLRHDKRVGVGGIKGFIRNYIMNISESYPFWNRTGGADHFYVACHSVGRTAMEKVVEVKLNAIQVVCSSSYFLADYVTHKDASIPQIWPRKGKPPIRSPSKRKRLAFYAGAMNSRVRKSLVNTWQNDSSISVHQSRLKTPYSEALLGSKFCIHAKGFEVNTARIGDALYYGCVPVILADHYDLPYADILNWNSFSVIFSTIDIPMLKKVLQEISSSGEYLKLQSNVMIVQKHFQWNNKPVDFDAFYMVMYELWLRRSHVSLSFN